MAKKWTPVYETFDCPEGIRLKADQLGIIIARGRKALATTEWPGENVRLCELREEPEIVHIPEEVMAVIREGLNSIWDELTTNHSAIPKHRDEIERIRMASDWLADHVDS